MNDTDQIAKLNRTLRHIMWMIVFPCVAATFFLLVEALDTVTLLFPRTRKSSDATTSIIVAAADIPAGTALGLQHFTTKLLWLSDPDGQYCVRATQATILLGHKTKLPLKAGDPIQWVNTDISIPER